MAQPLSQCPCCGVSFDSLSQLMAHIKNQHSEAEILLTATNDMKEVAIVA